MKSILILMKSCKGHRALEIALIVILLLLVFSIGGVPMVLLSTVTPPWVSDESAQQIDDDDGIEALNAQVATIAAGAV